MGRPALQLQGQSFGKLTVVERVPNQKKNSEWLCQCSCGNKVVRSGSALKHKRTFSCGCNVPKGEDHYNWSGGTWVDVHGYENTRVEGKQVKVHRFVMEEKLGRPLYDNENVHHINGVRNDNRPENLELWVTSQPSGQRPSDLVAWAEQILERYQQ